MSLYLTIFDGDDEITGWVFVNIPDVSVAESSHKCLIGIERMVFDIGNKDTHGGTIQRTAKILFRGL